MFDIAHEEVPYLYRLFKTVKPEKWREILHVWWRREMHTWILKENLNFRDYMEDICLDGKIILK
jgi:hypothetical protein